MEPECAPLYLSNHHRSLGKLLRDEHRIRVLWKRSVTGSRPRDVPPQPRPREVEPCTTES